MVLEDELVGRVESPPRECDLAPISSPYLLVTNIPCQRGADGRYYTDPLWEKDLKHHLEYIEDLTLLAPLSGSLPGEESRPLPVAPGRLRYVPVANPRSFAHAVFGLPAAWWRVRRAVLAAGVVHVGVAGWPIPLGWLAAPLARARRKFLVTVVESAPWRPRPGEPNPSLRRRAQSALFERMARRCVGLADCPVFTQSGYQSSLQSDARRGHVIPASWVDDSAILEESTADRDWATRLTNPARPLRVLFAGRLIAQKGVAILLTAARLLAARGVAVQIDLIGDGELAGECEREPSVRLRKPLSYGPEFFRVLRASDLVVVPSVGDEQPRIVYDAFSQAVPVVGSDTAGLRECVRHTVNGHLVPAGNPEALATALALFATEQRPALRPLGMNGLSAARQLTHREMHRRRWQILAEALADRQSLSPRET
jgi:glycosyltransferase involved in cell wall biosynthesis